MKFISQIRNVCTNNGTSNTNSIIKAYILNTITAISKIKYEWHRYNRFIFELSMPLTIGSESEFSQSLTYRDSPASPKTIITPVFKSGVQTSLSNYMPISLASTTTKVFEQMVRKNSCFLDWTRPSEQQEAWFQKWALFCLSALLDIFEYLREDKPCFGPKRI